jgi:hypothetical protein
MYYEIIVKGHVSEMLFKGLVVEWQEDATSKLCGNIVDQAALYGLLREIRDLGIELIAISPDKMD